MYRIALPKKLKNCAATWKTSTLHVECETTDSSNSSIEFVLDLVDAVTGVLLSSSKNRHYPYFIIKEIPTKKFNAIVYSKNFKVSFELRNWTGFLRVLMSFKGRLWGTFFHRELLQSIFIISLYII